MPRLLLCLTAFVLTSLSVQADEPASLLPADRPLPEIIDHYIDAALKTANVKAAPPADDAELLRRLTLDLAGRLPTAAEAAEYAANTDPDKKIKLVDRLIASSGFQRHQTQELYTLLQPEQGGRRGGTAGLRDYVKRAVAENRPWDRVFRELMLPDDADAKTKGSGDYLRTRLKDLNKLTIDVSTTFFGVNISCAQCHDHPLVHDWKQDHFYGLKSFFARTFENSGLIAEHEAGRVKYVPNKGKEKVAPVMFLTGKTIAAPNLREPTAQEKKKTQERINRAKKAKKAPELPAMSLRAKLVETALEPGQRDFFARAAVNRTWARLFGRGFVAPLDQMHSENPPSHPALLAWLARDLTGHGYDLRRLTRGLVLSRAYARASRWEGSEAPPEKLFAVAQVRALTPAQMAAALKIATTDPQALPTEKVQLEKRLEALENSAAGLAKHFPQPGDHFQIGASEALLFANNEALQRELFEGSSTLVNRLKGIADPAQRADLAVRVVLCRPARPDELRSLTEYLRQRADRADAANRQVVWALLTSAEFRFNH